MSIRRTLPALSLLLVAGTALAHPGHDEAGFLSGLGHPLGGLDHLLAMLAVGLYAARQPGALRWALPAGFVLAMLGGAGLGAMGLPLPLVETGVAGSVLVLGLLIALAVRLPLTAAVPLVALFALFHGVAHQAEMGSGSLAAYAAGFAATTAALHLAGMALAGVLPQSPFGQSLKRLVGASIAMSGALLLGV